MDKKKEKGIPAHKIGKQWKFKLTELDDWVFDENYLDSKTYLELKEIKITNLNNNVFKDVITLSSNNLEINVTFVNFEFTERCTKCSNGLNAQFVNFLKYVNEKVGEDYE